MAAIRGTVHCKKKSWPTVPNSVDFVRGGFGKVGEVGKERF